MMEKKESEKWPRTAAGLVLLSFFGVLLATGRPARAADLDNFDHQGKKLYMAGEVMPEVYLQADAGDRNLASYYELRQYPGSPPRIPHPVEPAFAGKETDCLSCHGKGGYSPEFGKFVPVTPHPENLLCYQCHVPLREGKPLVASTWQSIEPPRLGVSSLSSSPPIVPHGLQLRENCIACHTGPGAVTEIRVTHAFRGNCRQCHVPSVPTAELREFTR